MYHTFLFHWAILTSDTTQLRSLKCVMEIVGVKLFTGRILLLPHNKN